MQDNVKSNRLSLKPGQNLHSEINSQRNTASLLAHGNLRATHDSVNLEKAKNDDYHDAERERDTAPLSSNRNGLRYKIDTDNLIREYDLQRLSENKSEEFNSISSYNEMPRYGQGPVGMPNYDSRLDVDKGKYEEEFERRAFTHETFGEQQNARSLPISQV